MKNANRILIPSLSFGLLASTILTSHALSFTMYTDNQSVPAGTRDYAGAGAVTGPNSVAGFGAYQNGLSLAGVNGGNGVGYSTPSVVKFGDTVTNALSPVNSTGANSATFGGPADPKANVAFTFALQNGNHDGDPDPSVSGAPFDEFLVKGYLSGSVGYDASKAPSSTTKITFTSVQNLSATGLQQQFAVLTTSPNNGQAAEFIKVTVGTGASAQDYDVYLNQIQDIAAPGGQTLSISGFITTSGVPEPGSMALLLGLGVTGTTLLRRRKK